MHFKKNLFFLMLMSALCSCEVDEGVGGKATIKGTLILKQYNDDCSLLVNTLSASDEKVYIQYGDSKTVSDDVETSYDGYFEFNYLYEGDYTIFYYSKDSINPLDPKKEVLVSVHLNKEDSKDLGELITLETLDYDEGKATIKGSVYEIFYWNNTTIPKDTIISTDLPIFIRYGPHQQYDDRIRTQEDGSFYFSNLIPGDYTIYVFSEDTLDEDLQIAIVDSITIPNNEIKEYTLDDLFIHNL